MATVMMAAAAVLAMGTTAPQTAVTPHGADGFAGRTTDAPDVFRPVVAPLPEQRRIYEDVLILDHGDNLHAFESGIVWSILAVKGRLPSGEIVYVYEHFGETGQPVPPVSGRCRIETALTRWAGGIVWGENDIPEQPRDQIPKPADIWMIDRFDCSISSESPTIAPARTTVLPSGVSAGSRLSPPTETSLAGPLG